ncbi:hypothetical protein [Ruminococcus sp.]|uniref:hypothetical protein n=1 Tax=Ruminococcus sp. TaxID=41978 RepID=UPI00386D8F62
MAVTLKGQSAIYEGTSADMKPSDAAKNAIFQELDTGIDYYYDGTDWNEIPSSGGGGGGTGTDNYNELNNKPSINGTTLSGNKSLDNLGIQAKLTFDSTPTEDSKNPVTSGGVYSALAGKQDTISDLSTIRSGAATGASAVQPAAMEAALAQKQDALNSAQLAAVNSGTTADIVSAGTAALIGLVDGGAKNKLSIGIPTSVPTGLSCTRNTDGTYTVSGTLTSANSISFNIGAIEGDLVLSGCPEGGGNDTYLLRITKSGSQVTGSVDTGNGSDVFTMDETGYALNIRFAAGTYTDVVFKPMICTKADWDISQTYQPYAMSNAELTAAIQALQAQLANQ